MARGLVGVWASDSSWNIKYFTEDPTHRCSQSVLQRINVSKMASMPKGQGRRTRMLLRLRKCQLSSLADRVISLGEDK